MQSEGTSWPQFYRYSGLGIALGAEGNGGVRVWWVRRLCWGWVSVAGFLHWPLIFVAQPDWYFVTGIRTLRTVLLGLWLSGHNDCNWGRDTFGALAHWGHWGLPSWCRDSHMGAHGRSSGCEQVHCLFPPWGDQLRLETQEASSVSKWACWNAGGWVCQVGDGLGLAQLSSCSSTTCRRWKITTFLSLVVCKEPGPQQRRVRVAEEHSEIICFSSNICNSTSLWEQSICLVTLVILRHKIVLQAVGSLWHPCGSGSSTQHCGSSGRWVREEQCKQATGAPGPGFLKPLTAPLH